MSLRLLRCLLVPATMALMGRAAWWIPSSLDRRMPRISVEGHGYFAARDGGVAAEPATPAPPDRDPSARA